jgi:dipeptidyl aminopeptidase/acylaminoacyl peptidase
VFVLVLAAAIAAVGGGNATAPAKRAITFEDLISLDRISEVQISPDGKWVVYHISRPDKAANRSVNNIWIIPTAGGAPRQLTRSGRDSSPRWSPDGKTLAFLSSREGTPQVYLLNIEGGEAAALTHLSTGADNVQWSPDGKLLAFTSEVYPDCRDDACNSQRDAEREKSKVKARLYDHLLYRHWTTWSEGKRSHLFIVSRDGGAPRDLTPAANYDVPPVQRGGAEDIAVSPDNKEICFTAVTDPVEAISTNGDLFILPAGGGEPLRITTNPGFDGQPTYSPDGRWIAYHAQLRPGYESDKWRLMLYERQTGKHINVNENFDRNVENPVWAPDSKTIYFLAEDRGHKPVFAISATPGAEPRVLLKDTYESEVVLSKDGHTLVFTRTSLTMPAEIFAANTDGSNVRQLTQHNAEKLAALDLPPAEHFYFPGAEGTPIHAMLVRPPGFDPSKKYPLVLIAHGGPQTQWSDAWGYRWNPQMFAAPGYVVLLINRRGSTGFGQKFTDEINADWGGKPFVDLMKGVDYALEKYAFTDGTRMAAAGASYGGYMMDWFAAQTKGRFKAIVTHASVYNLESEYGATEELWFPEWEFRGTPWSNPGVYDKWSPHKYAGEFGKYKTPTLVTHGELDFRVPYTEGLQMFSALQRQGVPSKLLIFPDEGHWVLKPQNSELWYKTVLDWLATYLK